MTYPLDTLAPTIDETGIHAPTFFDIHESILALYRIIYGNDIYVTADSQDGQFIGIIAKAIDDCNQAAIGVFQSFSPVFAQGADLSALVKINGLARQAASFSSCIGDAVGVAGTIITNGVVKDQGGNLWNLPASVTIPLSGTIPVTVTAQELGAIEGTIGFIDTINNPQLGWQSFTSTVAVVPGAPIESDATLRERQSLSTELPAQTIKDSIYAGVADLPGVIRSTVHENDTSTTDVDGVPAHSISVIVLGGDTLQIAEEIALRKAPGIQTFGSISETVYDQYGLGTVIHFNPLTIVPIYYDITVKALFGYTSSTGLSIKQAVVDFTNSLDIQEDVYLSQAQAAASLISLGLGHTFYITAFKLGTSPSPTGTANLTIAFDQAASCELADVALAVT